MIGQGNQRHRTRSGEELRQVLAQYQAGEPSKFAVFQRLTGSGQLLWRYCQEAASSERGRLSRAEVETALEAIGSGGPPGSGGTIANAAKAAIWVSHALAGDDQAELTTGAAAIWDSDGPAVPSVPRDGTPASGEHVMAFSREHAIAVVPPDRQDRLRRLLEWLDEPVLGRGQAMVAISALMLAGARLDARPSVRVPVILARSRQDRKGGQGVTGVLEVRELPGGPGGLFPDPSALRIYQTDASFDRALTQAWKFAAGDHRHGRCVLWRLILDAGVPDFAVDGGSLGAAFAVALRELLSGGRPASALEAIGGVGRFFSRLRPDCAITGELPSDESSSGTRVPAQDYIGISARDKSPLLNPVGAMDAKLKAAEVKGWRLVAPAANRVAYASSAPDHVYWAKTVRQADRYARRARPLRVLGATSAAVIIAVGLTAGALISNSDNNARQERNAKQSGELASASENTGDKDAVVSRIQSLAAWAADPSPQARDALLRAAASTEIAALPGPDQADSVAFSPNGKTLAIGYGHGGGGTVELRNVATTKVIRRLSVGPGEVFSVAFSPDGRMLATGDGGTDCHGTVKLWNVTTGQLTRSLATAHSCEIDSVAFSPDGRMLATGERVGTVELWNVATAQLIPTPDIRVSFVYSVAFSPDGKMLAAGGVGGAEVWDVATKRLIRSLDAGGFTSANLLSSVAFSPDSAMLAAGDHAGTAEVWNVATWQLARTLDTGSDMVNSVAFSSDGTTLATGDDDGTALWSLTAIGPVGNLGAGLGPVNSVAFTRDGETLATADNNSTVRLWDARGSRVRSLAAVATTDVDSVAFNRDGTLATGDGYTGLVKLWNAATGQQLRSLTAGGVYNLAFSPDGKTLATANDHNPRSTGPVADMAEVWNLATGKKVNFITVAQVNSVAFSPDGKTLATGDSDGAALLWNLATGKKVSLSAGSQVNAVAFSPDGTMLATGDGGESGGAAAVWNLATGKRVNFVTGAQVNSVAFSPDNKTLAAGDSDGAAVLWNVATRQATRLSTDADDVTSVAFSPDGTTLAVGGGDAIYLYDVATGQLISRLASGSAGAYSYDPFSGYRVGSLGTDSSQVTGEVNSVAFNRDGTRLAASFGIGENDNLVTIWDTSYLADVPARVCAQAGNSLTPAAWKRYLPSGPPYQAVCPRHS